MASSTLSVPPTPGISFRMQESDTSTLSSQPSSSFPAQSSAAPSSRPREKDRPLDSEIFTNVARRWLTDALDRIPGSKTLILDPDMTGPLALFVNDIALLKTHAVDRLFYLESNALPQSVQRNVVYLCRPRKRLMRIIADQIHSASNIPGASSYTYTILLSPRCTSLCRSTLEDLGILGSVELVDFFYGTGLCRLEEDVLSLSLEESGELGSNGGGLNPVSSEPVEGLGGGFGKIFKDLDYGPIYDLGKALMIIQKAYGLIPRMLGKGDAARRLADLLLRLRREEPRGSLGVGAIQPGILDSLIILDRTVDPVTPLCTQLTYEGLIDEVIGIRSCNVEVDPSLLGAGSAPQPTPSSSSSATGPAGPRRKKQFLSSKSDPLFSELRDSNFAVVGATLNRVAKRINTDYEGRHAAKTIAQIRDFTGRLSSLQAEHQALRLHTGLTEEIMKTTMEDEFNRTLEIQHNLLAGVDLSTQENAIRDLINREVPLRTVIRMLCLYSIVAGGLKPKVLEDFKREVLQTYGFQHLPLFISLSNLSLLSPPTSTSTSSNPAQTRLNTFSQTRKLFKLIVEDVDEHNPTDVSYVYSGYAPLSLRVIQSACGNAGPGGGKGAGRLPTWKGVEDSVRGLPGGKLFEENQRLEDTDDQGSAAAARYGQSPEQKPTTIVCFLGGCTYTEISALRFLSRLPGAPRRFLVLTTGIVNGNTMVSSLMPPSTRSQDPIKFP